MADSDEEPLPPPSPLVEESVADSDDPYDDFCASMEEMVAAHNLRDWASLQEMLLCYLRINAKHNHALILDAFVDLLVGLASSSSSAAAMTREEEPEHCSGSSGTGTSCSPSTASSDQEEDLVLHVRLSSS